MNPTSDALELVPEKAPKDDAVAAQTERPWVFGLLIAPSAVVANGVIQGGVLAYLFSQQGMSSGEQARIVQWLALPTSLYFLWSPITDFFVRRRTWSRSRRL